MSIQCVRCKHDSVNVLTAEGTVTYKGKPLTYPIEYSLCEDCGYEYISKEQILKNDDVLRQEKRSADGLMSPSEIKAAREKLKLTQDMAAAIFGGGKNAFSKYERGEVVQSQAMDSLIRICLKYRMVMQDIANRSGVELEGAYLTETRRVPNLKVINCHKKEGKEFQKRSFLVQSKSYGAPLDEVING